MTSINSQALDEFSAGFRGEVITPASAGYDKARTIVMGGIDRRPALIAKVTSAADVARAIAFAHDEGLELAVRSGGHSGVGHSTTEGGLVIDVRGLNALEIDETAQTAWAGSGLTAGEFSAATTEKGLVVGFGDTGSVGIGGITLGGGVGYLSRKLGLTIDSLLAAEVVTADGKVIEASANSHPELFWALRGGGGNFGVVTRFKFRLHALPAFTGGMIALPATPETIAGFVKAAKRAPESLSTIANVMAGPPLPFLPAEVHGKPVIMGMLGFAGDDADAQTALKPFRDLAKPYADFIKPGSYMQMFPEDPGGGDEYHPTAVAQTMFMNDVDEATAATILKFLTSIEAPVRVAQLRVIGGAISRVADDATAYAHRSAPILTNVAAFYMSPADRAEKVKWVADFSKALHQGLDGGYVNFVGDEGESGVRGAYPGPTWERLRKVKKTYDPENLFRLNQNIPPAA